MKTKLSYLFAAAALLATPNSQLSTAQAQTTAITYQGQLASGAGNANGSYDLTFAVWDANVAGNFIAGPVTNIAVAVSNGLFTVTLDFGAGVFTGTNYWVEMGVRANGGGGFSTLVPRQPLTPTPYALSLSAQSPQVNSLCPPGSIMAYAGSTAPSGWLLCNTTVPVSRATYAALFAAIGTAYGTGDGSTTFNLPDFRGRFLRGVDAGAGNDPDAGSRSPMNNGGNSGNNVGSVQINATAKNGLNLAGSTSFASASHTHGAGSLGALVFRGGSDAIISTGSTTGSYPPGSNHRNAGGWSSDAGNYGGSPTTRVEGTTAGASASAAVSLGNGDSETRPVNAYVNYIIKY